ncbi:hypothetical protein CR513_29778, partial [Mucuna pruriens]
MRVNSPSFQGRSNLCGSKREDQNERTNLETNFKSECPNFEKKEEKEKKKLFIKKKKSLMGTWEDLDLSS